MVWARLVTTSTPLQPYIKENSVLKACWANIPYVCWGEHCPHVHVMLLTYTEVLTVAITLNITNLVLYNTVGRVLNVWFNDCVLCWLKPNCESNNCVS